jgi:hypothetical protein
VAAGSTLLNDRPTARGPAPSRRKRLAGCSWLLLHYQEPLSRLARHATVTKSPPAVIPSEQHQQHLPTGSERYPRWGQLRTQPAPTTRACPATALRPKTPPRPPVNCQVQHYRWPKACIPGSRVRMPIPVPAEQRGDQHEHPPLSILAAPAELASWLWTAFCGGSVGGLYPPRS